MLPIETFILELPEQEKEISTFLRYQVIENIPGIREKLSYGVPFYYMNHRLCFIWPSSVLRGGHRKGVILGFCQGYKLSNIHHLLSSEGRKEVYTKTYLHIEQAIADEEVILDTLFEAVEIDNDAAITHS